MRSLSLILCGFLVITAFGLAASPHARAAVVKPGAQSPLCSEEVEHYAAVSGSSPFWGHMTAGRWEWNTATVIIACLAVILVFGAAGLISGHFWYF